MIDAEVHVIAVVAEVEAVSAPRVGIVELAREHMMGVGERRVVEVSANDNVGSRAFVYLLT